MGSLDPVALERVRRVLAFLGVAGGAALVSRRRLGILAVVGELEMSFLVAARFLPLAGPGQVVHVEGALLADVGGAYRLVVRVPSGAMDRAFADRVQRAAALLEQHVFSAAPPAPSTPTPASAAVVFAEPKRH